VTFTAQYLSETIDILNEIDHAQIEAVAEGLAAVIGRVFVLGNGGSAATASHLCSDLRKMCGREAYCPSDNVTELTARANDEGFHTVFYGWLQWLTADDALLVFSVGGGGSEVSGNITDAVNLANQTGCPTFGIVGRDGGTTALYGTTCVIIPPMFEDRITPHTEGIASVLAHLIVSHPALSK
jgi:D-sedoheptulose 7-phosphate isomerase